MLLFVLDACLRLVVDLALARFRDSPPRQADRAGRPGAPPAKALLVHAAGGSVVDRTRWRLEDKLGHVLAEIGQRADLDDQGEEENERRERACGSACHTALRQAWERLLTDHRVRLTTDDETAAKGGQLFASGATAILLARPSLSGLARLATAKRVTGRSPAEGCYTRAAIHGASSNLVYCWRRIGTLVWKMTAVVCIQQVLLRSIL